MDKFELKIISENDETVHEFSSCTIKNWPADKEAFMTELIESLQEGQDSCNQSLTSIVEQQN